MRWLLVVAFMGGGGAEPRLLGPYPSHQECLEDGRALETALDDTRIVPLFGLTWRCVEGYWR